MAFVDWFKVILNEIAYRHERHHWAGGREGDSGALCNFAPKMRRTRYRGVCARSLQGGYCARQRYRAKGDDAQQNKEISDSEKERNSIRFGLSPCLRAVQ